MKYLIILLFVFNSLLAYVYVEFGKNVPILFKDRFEFHLGKFTKVIKSDNNELKSGILFSLGDTSRSQKLISDNELKKLGQEGFIIKTTKINNLKLIVLRGNKVDVSEKNLGLIYGMYEVLSELGVAFYHPFETIYPLKFNYDIYVNKTEKPSWKFRGIHTHTMHPIELAEFLNGWGDSGFENYEEWENQFSFFNKFLEWMLAHKLNTLQWVLLNGKDWKSFGNSDERLSRLKKIVEQIHEYGLKVGLDVPLVFRQQNSFTLLEKEGKEKFEEESIIKRIDWIMKANFDFLSTEMGYSEFHHPDPQKMLKWLNHAVRYLKEKYGKEFYTKVHISTGQKVKEYKDPHTGKPLNFNFLPQHADKKLGVLPHTVQFYSLEDKLSTYGNSDFSEMRNFIKREMKERPVIWYPETAYWIGFDIDVPLFLPIYLQNRVHDLRLINNDEYEQNTKIRGQLFFSSGWEWSYWLNDVVTAKASWDPHIKEVDSTESTRKILFSIFSHYKNYSEKIANIIINIIKIQKKLFLLKNEVVNNQYTHEGHAYLQGEETWKEISSLLNKFSSSINFKPVKMNFHTLKRSNKYKKSYKSFIENKLNEMEILLVKEDEKLDNIIKTIKTSKGLTQILEEISDSLKITILRIKFIRNIYAGSYNFGSLSFDDHVKKANELLNSAEIIVKKREKIYRMDPKKISSWRKNPTSYDFTYLWTVSSLYYWKRDLKKLTHENYFWNPCSFNINNPFKIAFGAEIKYDVLQTFLQSKFFKTLFPLTSQCFVIQPDLFMNF